MIFDIVTAWGISISRKNGKKAIIQMAEKEKYR